MLDKRYAQAEFYRNNASLANICVAGIVRFDGQCYPLKRSRRSRMESYAWLLWVLVGAAFVVAEIFTLGFVLFWFGLGAFAAAIASFFGAPFVVQILIFLFSSVAMVVMSRRIFADYFSHGDKDYVKMGIESLPGQVGTVVGMSEGPLKEAAVKVFGSTWTAFPIDEETSLKEGEKVEVVEVRGSSLYVRRKTDALPDWREG
ncbi:MAG: NfeD family protein [Acidobacteria bacterium ACB1]|nr:NfeD family protein [Acidobacteria bacterium ACB1]